MFALRGHVHDRYACERSTGRRYLLNPGGEFADTLHAFVLKGAYLSFNDSFDTGTETGSSLVVADVPAGRSLPLEPFPTRFLIATDGAIAWVSGKIVDNLMGYQIFTAGKTGIRLLDGGFDIDPTSLMLSDQAVTWTNAGQPRNAKLVGPITRRSTHPLQRAPA